MARNCTLDASVVADAVDRCLDPVRPRPDYSGRGMYGDCCLGVVVSSLGGAFEFALAVSELLAERAETYDDPADHERLEDWRETVRTARSDSMGLDLIVYWPRTTVSGDLTEYLED